MLYHATKSARQVVKALRNGDLVSMIKALGKAKALKRLATTVAESVLDGLREHGDDDDEPTKH